MTAGRGTRALLLSQSLLISCGTPRSPSPEHPGQRDSETSPVETRALEHLSGRVFVTGSEPWTSVTLVPPQGRGVTLVGDLQGELRRLSGAAVRVVGARRGRPGDLDVESYVVLEVDGDVPKVGILRERDGTLWLDGHDTVEVVTPPVDLRAKEGAKVWIVGRPAGKGLAVQSYGILRENGR